MVKTGLIELKDFFIYFVQILKIFVITLFRRPIHLVKLGGRLLKSLNLAMSSFLKNYRLTSRGFSRFHGYDIEELKKLKFRADGLLKLFIQGRKTKIKCFTFVNLNDDLKSFFASLEELAKPTDTEIICIFKNQTELTNFLSNKVFAQYKTILATDLQIYIKQNLGADYFVFCDSKSWLRSDILYRGLQVDDLLIKKDSHFITCNEVAFENSEEILPETRLYYRFDEDLVDYYQFDFTHFTFLNAKALNLDKDLAKPVFQVSELVKVFIRNNKKSVQIPIELCQFYTSRSEFEAHKQNNFFELKSFEQSSVADSHINKKDVHVIIPYKENKEMTINCLKSLLTQQGVQLSITFIDNGSKDLSIKQALIDYGSSQGLSVEVLRLEEPFNYSRINNFGYKNSTFKDLGQFVLFLNNDVILDSKSIFFMLKNLIEKNAGAVGAKLFFEDGSLQHNGIYIESDHNTIIPWSHQDFALSPDKSLNFTREVLAVTGACLLMSKELFVQVGLWNEDHFPIAFSDTDLCRRIRRAKKSILICNEATGLHLESKTRGYSLIEDFEASTWLFWMTEQRRRANQLKSPILDVSELF